MNQGLFPSTKTKVLPGPAANSEFYPEIYSPVDCDFTDELEYVAVKKIEVEITYRISMDETATVRGLVKDIVTANKEEHLKFSDGASIRLDRLVQLRIVG